ncbi:MAG: hypothetical protein HYR56_20555 [Acidobacteria bacterium]|nr:hypothetical protein [Acidobacteriota bacterium]MBI3427712.1 hypothetical protein [Acidobacteriota bacterium]
MNTDEQSIQLLTALAARLRDDPVFMAHTLARYQQQRGLDDRKLAAELGALPEMVLRLALCRRPVTGAPDFAEQVRALADFALLDETRLARVMRRVDELNEAKALPRNFRAHWLAGARAAWAALAPARVPLLAGAVGLIFFVVTGALLWRAYHWPPTQNSAQQRPQPAATSSMATTSVTPAPHDSTPPSGTHASTAAPLPEIMTVKIDLEDYPSLRAAEAVSNEATKVIHLPAARARLVLRLPENSARGWYRVRLLGDSGKTVGTAKAMSIDGKSLSVPLDLRGLRAAKYLLRLTHADEPPADYPASINRLSGRRKNQGDAQ